MKTRLLSAAAALVVLFGVNEASATTYTIDVDYNLLDGQFFDLITNNGSQQLVNGDRFFWGRNIPVSLPTLHVGDVIDTTINFTMGLALTINNSGTGTLPANLQNIQVQYFQNNPPSVGFNVITSVQLSLLHAHGDLLIPDPLTQLNISGATVGAAASGHFTDSSFSFRGLNIVSTILDTPELLGPYDQMSLTVAASSNDDGRLNFNGANIEITHGASGNPVDPVPLPAALPLFATSLGALGLLGWRRKRKAQSAA